MSHDPCMCDLYFSKWRRSRVLMESPWVIYQRSLSRKALLGPTSPTTSTFTVTLGGPGGGEIEIDSQAENRCIK